MVSLMALHRDPTYWPNPMEFDPDRFLPEEVEKRPNYSFLPFSGGPRNCLGMTFAMMQMKIVIASLVKSYILKKNTVGSVKDVRLKLGMVIKPVQPITVSLRSRF